MAKSNTTTAIDSLEALQQRREELSEKIDKSEEKLSGIWHEMFHAPTPEERNSPTQRALSFISSSAGLIDGAIFGWKIYRKFSNGKQFIPFLKKKK